MNIIQRPSPNQSGTLSPRAIMLHHTGPGSTSVTGIAAWIQSRTASVSYHFLVGKGGEVIQQVPLNRRAWHAGNGAGTGPVPRNGGNTYSVGIGLVNLGNGSDPYPAAQLKALNSLIAYLDKTIGRKPIIDHKQYAPGRKVDMRANFPLSAYKAYRMDKAPEKPKPAPKPKPTTYTLRRTLRLTRIRYMRGSDVGQLQRALGGLRVDSVFGPNTHSAVVRFQRSKKLVPDGIVGPATARALGWKWA